MQILKSKNKVITIGNYSSCIFVLAIFEVSNSLCVVFVGCFAVFGVENIYDIIAIKVKSFDFAFLNFANKMSVLGLTWLLLCKTR